MNDAPIQTVLQQHDARPVAGEHLEVLGKQAAADWSMGKAASLNDAVVSIVREERLSPEQVRRVVEFTNQAAYLHEFNKMGQAHRVVHFENGPASASQVLQDLNDGGGGTIFDRGTLDYQMPPELGRKEASYRSGVTLEFDKTASAESDPPVAGLPKLVKVPSLPKIAHSHERHEDEFWALFGNNEGGKIAMSDPLQPLKEVRDKIAGARDQALSELNGLEVDFQVATGELYEQVKQAALGGTSLGEVVAAWHTVCDEPLYAKVAFSRITPKLREAHLFNSLDDIGQSLLKTAGAQQALVDPTHPLVTVYETFCETLGKLASMRALHTELSTGAADAESVLKEAARGGLIGGAQKAISMASEGIDRASPAVAHALVGAKDAKKLAPTVAKGLKGTALVGTALAGNAALQNVTDRPAVHGVLESAKSVVPGTMEYQNRRYRNMTGQ